MKYLFILLFIATNALASGNLSLTPSHDPNFGNGLTTALEIDEEVFPKWHLVPVISFTSVSSYSDTVGKLDLHYDWTERISVGIGTGYDKFHVYGEDPIYYTDLHTSISYKLW